MEMDGAQLVLAACVLVAAAAATALLARRLGGAAGSTARIPAAARAQNARAAAAAASAGGGKPLTIVYGTQTGTAERFAKALAKEAAARYGAALSAECVEIDDFDYEERLAEADEEGLTVMLFATYGDGEPTDDAMEFVEWLAQEAEIESDVVAGRKYAVFALGNRQYEHFNATGKAIFKDFGAAGGEAVMRLGLGDDDADIEADFADWKEEFWGALEQALDVSVADGADGGAGVPMAAYDVSALAGADGAAAAAASAPGAARKRPPYTEANPFVAKIGAKAELHTAESDRSCLHVEVDLSGSNLRYTTGDHVGVLPCNSDRDVMRAAALIKGGTDMLDTAVAVSVPEDVDLPALPSPTTLRALLTHYIDLTGPVRRSQLLALAACAPDEESAAELRAHAAAGKGAADVFKGKYHDGKASVLDVMVAHGCTPDVGLFLGSVGTRLAPRFFSISSSNRAHPGHVHITAAVVTEDKPYSGGMLEGVCTHHLSRLREGDRIAVFLRQSTFRLPKDPTKPVVMVGPGTGLAPFRAFLQERAALQEGGNTLGPAVTFFGCRRPDADFIYEEEMREFERTGVTQLQVAFSRVGKAKRYVQHDLAERGGEVWQWLSSKKGYMYVCGDAKHMAKDVHKALVQLGVDSGLSEARAEDALRQLHDEGRYQRDVW